MFCEKCGNEISGDTAFCPYCGAAKSKASQDQIVNPMPYGYTNVNNPYSGTGNQYVNKGYAPPAQPAVNLQYMPAEEKKRNVFCLISFILGIGGIFFAGVYLGIAAFIIGIIGTATYDETKHKGGKWMGIAGIVLGIIDFLVALLIVGWILGEFYSSFSDIIGEFYSSFSDIRGILKTI